MKCSHIFQDYLKSRIFKFAICFVLAMPPVSTWIESTMLTHMVIHIPIWLALGWILGDFICKNHQSLVERTYVFRWAFLILASATITVWMIPRFLDLAFTEIDVDLIKILSLIFLAGLPLRLAWENMGPVSRGLFLVEALASFWRLGWIYLTSPARLCIQYGMDDQIYLGYTLIFIGYIAAAWMVWRTVLFPSSVNKLQT